MAIDEMGKMKFTISHGDLTTLKDALEEGLSKALQNPSQSEPQLVANMVYHVPRAINTICGSLPIRSGGVFVHQQPLVKCNNFPNASPASVEIGDLLILRSEVKGGTACSRKALLLQAKKFNRLPTSPDNKNQHHLYATWPSFQYNRSTDKLNGKKRHITGIDLYNACKYLLIGNYPFRFLCSPIRFFCSPNILCHSGNHCVLSAQPETPDLSHYRCFFEELLDFILGDAGKTYLSPPPPKKRNWDRVIQDLIDVTAKRASVHMRRASAGVSQQRGQLCFLSGDFLHGESIFKFSKKLMRNYYFDNEPPEVSTEWPSLDDPESGGISIIEFVVSFENENGRPE